MFDFLAKATTNSWDENVFQLTTSGVMTVIAAIIVLIVVAILLRPKKEKALTYSTKQLVFSALAMALSLVTSFFKFLELPMGGSITLFSMFFITLIGYWYGAKIGVITAIAYGLLQFVIDPVFYTPVQMIVDYPLAFGALGLSGIFSNKKNGLIKGYITGVLGRYFFSFLSGLIFFASYAEGSGMSAPIYSLSYNGMYIIPEAIITVILLVVPSISRALTHVKTMVIE